MTINKTQNEAIIDAINDISDLNDNWSTKTIYIFRNEEGYWCVKTEETYEDKDN